MILLRLAARHGPWVLAAGLVVGLVWSERFVGLRPWLPEMAAGLLFVSCLQIEPRALLGSLAEAPRVIALVVPLQALPPLVILLAALATGGMTPAALALILMTAAPAIVGSPNLCMMLGLPPDHAMRLMVVGTALLPATVLPVLWLMPELGGPAAVLGTVLDLGLTIAAAGGAAMLIRRRLLNPMTPEKTEALRGVSAIALAVFVLGLMSPLAETFAADPVSGLSWLALAFGANLGLQIAAWRLTRRRLPRDVAAPVSLIAGNRNIALFLVALPPEVTGMALTFIAAYQAPMYLTPLLMRRIYGIDRA